MQTEGDITVTHRVNIGLIVCPVTRNMTEMLDRKAISHIIDISQDLIDAQYPFISHAR